MVARSSSPRRQRAASTGSVLHQSDVHNRSQSPARRNAKGVQQSFPQAALAQRSKQEVDDDFQNLLNRFEVTEPTRSKLASLSTIVKEDFLRRESELTASSFSLFGGTHPSSSSSASRSRPSSPVRQPRVLSHGEDKLDELRPPDRRALFGGGRFGASSSSVDLNNSAGSSRVPSSGSHQSTSSSSPIKKQRSPTKRSAQDTELPQSNRPFERNERGRGRMGAAATSAIRSLSPSRQTAQASSSNNASPASYAKMLLHNSSRSLDIDKLRRLRVLLSAESPAWLGDFLFTHRGYEGMLKRVGELVEMDWREDIHDDKALHELLRGMNALGATESGLVALSSLLFRPYLPQLPPGGSPSSHHLPESAPAAFIGKEDTPPELPLAWELHPPFGPLAGLLLSEKKPGELKTRRLLIDMLGLLLSIKLPPGLVDADCFRELQDKREVSTFYHAFKAAAPVTASPLHLLLLLLHNPIQLRSLSMLPFISMSHQPRPFKSYLNELLSVARDYFWIFCHSGSRFWDWEGMGEAGRQQRGGPSVPGGMTDGVEWEAMSYLTANLNLVNRIAKLLPAADGTAYHFHASLFDSGMERLLQLMRKASQKYYPLAHLAMAQYLFLARRAGYRLPTSIDMRCEGGLALRLDCGLPDIPSRTAASTSYSPEGAFTSPTRAVEEGSEPTRRPPSPQRLESPALGALLPAFSSNNVGTGQWLKRGNSTADDLAAAQAFLTTSASEEAFFNAPIVTSTVAQTGASPPREEAKRRGRKSRSLSPMRKQQRSTMAELAMPLVSPVNASSAQGNSAQEDAAAFAGRDAGCLDSSRPGRGKAAIVALGTAKDRIKLWEGRAATAYDSRGSSSDNGSRNSATGIGRAGAASVAASGGVGRR